MVVDTDTGEIVGDRFAKMFFEDMESLFKLTGTERALFDCMIRDSKLGGKNIINMTPKIKKRIAKEIGLSTYRTISNCLISMGHKSVIQDKRSDTHPYTWAINPNLFFKGNDYQRARILIEYSGGERNVRAFPNAEAVATYMETH